MTRLLTIAPNLEALKAQSLDAVRRGKPSDVCIGTLDGHPVTGHTSYDSVDGSYDHYAVSVTWRGLPLSTDGSSYISFTSSYSGGVGDYSLSEWETMQAFVCSDLAGPLKELALMWTHAGRQTDPAPFCPNIKTIGYEAWSRWQEDLRANT